jgi:hypothetical protein
MTVKFKFRVHPGDPSTARPFVWVQLAVGNLKTPWDSFALVDSGAATTLFPVSFAAFLTSLDFSDQHPRRGGVIWRGQLFPTWIHRVEIRIRGDAASHVPSRIISGMGSVEFWKDRDDSGKLVTGPAPYLLLGQSGVLEHLIFTEAAGRKTFRLKPDLFLKHPWREA